MERALRLGKHRAVAFTGAGGKSSAIRQLVDELPRAIVTTTTRIGQSQNDLAHVHLLASAPDLEAELRRAIEGDGSVIVTGPAQGEKWTAVVSPTLESLHRWARELEAHLLIEADGARGGSIKAPARHEPVIPSWVDLVVPVAGADAFGQTLSSDLVHRPELLGPLAQLSGGQAIEPVHLAAALGSPQGGCKGVPPGAEARPLLNKVEGRQESAEQAARLALDQAPLAGVLLGEVQSDRPVRKVMGRVAGIVLAAGGSSRLGRPKQLIQWRDAPLVRHVVEGAQLGDLDPLVIVTGAFADEVRAAVSGMNLEFTHNPDWGIGLSTSVRAGMAALPRNVEAVVFLLADMPLIPAQLIKRLLEVHRRTLSAIVAPKAGGRRANPVLFDRETFEALMRLKGDQGGRALFDRFPADWVDWDAEILFDLDTEADLRRLKDLE